MSRIQEEIDLILYLLTQSEAEIIGHLILTILCFCGAHFFHL